DNSISNQSAPNFDQYFELNKLKAQSQETDTVIKKLKERIKSLSGNMNEDKVKKDIEEIELINIELDHREKDLVITALKDELRKLKEKDLANNVVTKHTIAPEMLKIDVEPIALRLLNNRITHSDYLRHTQEQAAILREIVEQGKSQNSLNKSLDSACKYTKQIQELLIIIRQTCPSINNSSDKLVAVTPKNKDKRVRFTKLVTSSGKTNTKSSKRKVWKPTGKVFPNIGYTWRPTGRTFNIVGNACPLTRITTTVEVPLRKPTVLESDTPKPVITLVYSRKPRKSKTNVPVSKPKIIKSISANKKEPSKSWGSIVSDVPSSSLDECRSKDEAPDFIIKFLKMIQVWLKVPVRRIRTYNGTEFVNQTLREYYEKVGISLETYVARSPQQNGVVERRNRTLIEASCTMLIYAKAPLFLWAEAVATACYTQNRSIIRLRHGKTPYELLHDKLSDLSFFYVFGGLCYPTNDSENLGKLQPKADISIFIGYAPTKKAFRIYNRRTRRIIEIIHVEFDELTTMASEHSSSGPALHEMTPATITPKVIAPIAEVVAPEPAASTGSPSSTTVDQDAPSPSVAHMNNDPFFGIPIPENNSKASSSSDVIPTVVQTAAPYSEHVNKWTKDHPLDNIIGELERHVSTRLQLHEQALFCYYDAFLTSVEPKNYKDALTQACWIEAMQEELNELNILKSGHSFLIQIK
ncbi:retrovirus-related pol polyprotein from transposon TNT 1-94, partial [Tanacetum coccineum]